MTLGKDGVDAHTAAAHWNPGIIDRIPKIW